MHPTTSKTSVEKTNYSIMNLVESIDRGNILLPEFQRDFVWDIVKTFDLFDSLVQNIFIGSIIYGRPSFDLALREIDKRPRKGKGSRDKTKVKLWKEYEFKKQPELRILLDGQQRITSLYRALKGYDTIYMVLKNNIANPGNVKLEEMVESFQGHPVEDKVSVLISDIYFKADKLDIEKLPSEYQDKPEQAKLYLYAFQKMRDILKQESIISIFLLDMSLDKFCTFFERSNSLGVNLDFIDILVAKVYTGFNLREKIDEYNNSNRNHKLNPEIIVRSLSFIKSSSSTNVGTTNKDYILKNITAADFQQYWDDLVRYYSVSYNYLVDNKLIATSSYIAYENLLIPMIILLHYSKYQNFTQFNKEILGYINKWYWRMIFSARYGGMSNQAIEEDCGYMKRLINDKNTESFNKHINSYKIEIAESSDIVDLKSTRSAMFNGILNLIYHDTAGVIDWNGAKLINGKQQQIDEHHIFPKGYLKELSKNKESEVDPNSVINKMLISKLQNILIGKKKPSEYLQEYIRKNPQEHITDVLKSHIIPNPDKLISGYYDENFDEFAIDRANLLYDLIKKYT